MGLHRKALRSKDFLYLLEFAGDTFNVGPLGVLVAACPNQQRMAF